MMYKVEVIIYAIAIGEEKKDLIKFFVPVEEAKILTISIFPFMTALSIGVTVKNDFVSLGLTVKGAKILTMSVCPFIAAYSIGVKSDFD